MHQYALEKIKEEIIALIQKDANISISISDIELPPAHTGADLAVPMFKIAKERGVSPKQLAELLIQKINLDGAFFVKTEIRGGFLNFIFNAEKFNELVFEDFNKLGEQYGGSQIGKNKKIIIDYSAPNIAKPFSVGHLRSTIIGQSLYNIFSFLGYEVIGDNHIGDWGTQFGKLIYAYKQWGDRETIEKSPIKELLKLYVKFHEEAQKNSKLEDEGRFWFKELENKNLEVMKLWQWIRDVSLKEFERIYNLLGVKFDFTLGESFYNDKLQEVVDEIFKKGLGRWEKTLDRKLEIEDNQTGEVALVPLDQYGIEAPLLIQKSDGASLYATRDLATAKYRVKKWNPEKIIYVVGNEQQLYFKQWFKVFGLMGYQTSCVHIGFGLIRLAEGKMSTRRGQVIFLEDVLSRAIKQARGVIESHNLTQKDKEAIARIVGIGAIKYADLSQNRNKDIVFDWKKMLNMQGDSAPYLQYAYVRIQSILRKVEKDNVEEADSKLLSALEEINLIKHLAQFPVIIERAANDYCPHIIANYLFQLSQLFNGFYDKSPVLQAKTKDLKSARLFLCKASAQTLKTGLKLLGIDCPDKM